MTTKERREAARLVVKALAMLPQEQRRYIIGYAEGVIDASAKREAAESRQAG